MMRERQKEKREGFWLWNDWTALHAVSVAAKTKKNIATWQVARHASPRLIKPRAIKPARTWLVLCLEASYFSSLHPSQPVTFSLILFFFPSISFPPPCVFYSISTLFFYCRIFKKHLFGAGWSLFFSPPSFLRLILFLLFPFIPPAMSTVTLVCQAGPMHFSYSLESWWCSKKNK